MSRPNEQMSLGAFLFSFGHHFAAWRYEGTKTDGVIDMNFYKEIAKTAERGKMDMLFLADGLSLPDKADVASNVSAVYPEATTVITALAGVTERIGLAATLSTTFNEPFNVARRFATLDHLSGGRAAWNVVTSTKNSDARNFSGRDLPEHGVRYERAEEFLDIVTGLWDSWEDEALLFDKASGAFADPSRIHQISHEGTAFSVKGPLNIPRPPQGKPVIVEAGTSPSGQRLAAKTADVVFTACEDKEEARRFYAGLKAQLPEFEREPHELKVMPGVLTFIGDTESEAIEKEAELSELISPDAVVANLSRMVNVDLSGYPIDGPFPDIPLKGNSSRAFMVADLARQRNLTLRQLGFHFSVARGHLVLRGTPEQIADQMEDWFVSKACDGFNVMPPYLPGGLGEFVDKVVPLLQRRGVFRTEYAGRTLRDHLGLNRPANRFRRLPAPY
ncbi:LLM class flavin-dependent oxidoreductase [Cohnella faecalis]|uniref:FMN-dependent monooxygenase n=1 Tax=Cohnella faecalis TaxID=2315694 RepID=A0A398CM35_9BACL|nr:LLM class flavin-dependent oxidoreductase [Cohnella faecalis]RIE02279.1 FMN-dependent monooxygenase [Cohnella faecalis]